MNSYHITVLAAEVLVLISPTEFTLADIAEVPTIE